MQDLNSSNQQSSQPHWLTIAKVYAPADPVQAHTAERVVEQTPGVTDVQIDLDYVRVEVGEVYEIEIAEDGSIVVYSAEEVVDRYAGAVEYEEAALGEAYEDVSTAQDPYDPAEHMTCPACGSGRRKGLCRCNTVGVH